MRSITGLVILFFVVPLCSAGPASALDLSLDFSTDGGRTFSDDFPALSKPGKVRVRVLWTVRDFGVVAGVVLVGCRSADADFASANVGRQSWGKRASWYQWPIPHWFGQGKDSTTIIVDMGARPAGTMGHHNRWDKAKGKFVDGPLPACPARGPGQHRFTVTVHYRHKKTGKKVEAVKDFFVEIRSPGAERSAPEERKRPVVEAAGVDPARVALPRADIVLAAGDCVPYAGTGAPEKRGPFVRFKGEAAWRLPDVAAGRYYLGLFAVIGNRNREEHLRKPLPWLYVNGRAIQLATCADPVDVAGVGVVGELQSADAVALEPGDEIRLHRDVARRWVAQLALYRPRPEQGPLDVRPFVSAVNDDILRTTAQLTIPDEPRAAAKARMSVQNVSGHGRKVEITWRVLNYFCETIEEGSTPAELADREIWRKEIAFDWGSSDRYRLIVTATDADGHVQEAVAEELTPARFSAFRGAAWLNAKWQMHLLPAGAKETGPLPGRTASWKKIGFPGFWPYNNNLMPVKNHCAWARRSFRVPNTMPEGRIILRFSGVNHEAHVYVNRKLAGTHSSHRDPFDIDVTEFVDRTSQNELLLGLRDGTLAAYRDGRQISPRGGRCGYVSDVRIISRPVVAVTDVFVKPSFRNKRLDIDTTVDAVAVGYTVDHAVLFNGRKVLDIPRARIGADGTATTGAVWKDPVLWDIGKPNLLRLDTRLVDPDGKLVDTVSTRFGFCETWPQGRDLYLNGRRVKLRAYAMDGSWTSERGSRKELRRRHREALKLTAQARLHGGAWHNLLDTADEEGMLIALNIAGPGHPSQAIVENDEYWENLTAMARRAAGQFRNHPCIFEWKLSNEFSERATLPELATKRLQRLGQGVRDVDPTRLLEFSCDLDIRGWADIVSTHYPVDVRALCIPTAYLPEAMLWRPAGVPFEPGMKVPSGQVRAAANVNLTKSPMRWGLKPILVNETGWNLFYGPPGGFAAVASERVYRGPWACAEAHTVVNEWFMAGHRDAEVSLICPWQRYEFGVLSRLLPAIDAFPLTRHTRWYEGQEVVWDVNIHHDVEREGEVRFSWLLRLDDGRELSRALTRRMQPAELFRSKIRFTTPRVDRDTSARLVLRIVKEGVIVRQREFTCRVFDRAARGLPTRGVVLFDPLGRTAESFARIGFNPTRIDRVDRDAFDGVRVLIIGSSCADDTGLVKHAGALKDAVSGGLAVIVLHQEKIDFTWAPQSLNISDKQTSIAFRRAPNHPVLRGVTDDDMRFWFPAHRLSSRDFVKPDHGNCRALLDAGLGHRDMEYTPLVEMRHGNGVYLFCQLHVTDLLGLNPVCDRILRNALTSYSRRTFEARPAAVLNPGAHLGLALPRLGLVSERFNPEKARQYRCIIVDAQARPADADLAGLKRALAAGGNVLVHAVTPDASSWIAELTGSEIAVRPPVLKSWHGRLIRRTNHPLTDGISNADLFWRRRPEGQDVTRIFESDTFVMDPLFEYVVHCESGTALTYPAALVAVPAGKGTVLLDTIRWDRCKNTVKRQAGRLASVLLTNLGCELRPQREKVWLKGLDYAHISLDAFLNRSLADDVPDDGKGGWSDQGPDTDLRDFKPGEHEFRGVPFVVRSPPSCIVLTSRFRKKGDLPGAVRGIPVDRKCRALYFLQSSAWTGPKHHASYVIHYDDGSQQEVMLIGDVNLRDWAASKADAPFPLESETFTQQAWTGTSERFKTVSLYVMQWVNPYHEKKITTLDFVGQNQGVPILLAVTAGAARRQEQLRAGDRRKALEFDERARRAIERGQTGVGEGLLRKAVRADPSFMAGRMRLASVLLESGQAAKAEIELKDVIRLKPDVLEAYEKLGLVYERAREWDKARALYKRSLEVNPNQPAMYAALQRVRAAERGGR